MVQHGVAMGGSLRLAAEPLGDSLAAERAGRVGIHAEVVLAPEQRDLEDVARRGGRDVAVLHVGADGLGIALDGVAVAGARGERHLVDV